MLMDHSMEVPQLEGHLLSCEIICKSDALLYDLTIKDPINKKDIAEIGKHISQFSYW